MKFVTKNYIELTEYEKAHLVGAAVALKNYEMDEAEYLEVIISFMNRAINVALEE